MSSLLGGVRSGLGGVRTTGESSAGSSPAPPTPSSASLFDLTLSFGHGMDVDTHLPDNQPFWLSPSTIADTAIGIDPGSPFCVREWRVDQALAFVGLDLVVTLSDLDGETLPVIVTINGLDSALSIAVPDAISTATAFEASAFLAVPAGATIGVRVDGTLILNGSLIMQARVFGAATGTPSIPDTLPTTPLALFRPEDLALDGNTWVDSVAGNLYTCTVPPDGPPPPGVDPISGPARISDGSFNNNPYGYFRHYHGTDFGNPIYTPCMLATSTSMFAASLPPIAPRSIVAVVRAESSVGGIVACTQFTTPNFKGALSLPLGDLQQSPYFDRGTPDSGGQVAHNIPAVNLAAEEVVLIWRTDGSTVEFFIDGVKQTLDDATVGSDFAAGEGFCIGNLASSKPIGKTGWQGAICFVGVWARKLTNAEVLSATGNLSALYVTP